MRRSSVRSILFARVQGSEGQRVRARDGARLVDGSHLAWTLGPLGPWALGPLFMRAPTARRDPLPAPPPPVNRAAYAMVPAPPPSRRAGRTRCAPHRPLPPASLPIGSTRETPSAAG